MPTQVYLKFTNHNQHQNIYVLTAGVVKVGMSMYPVVEDDGNAHFVGEIPTVATQFMLAIEATNGGYVSNRFRIFIQTNSLNLPIKISIYEENLLIIKDADKNTETVINLSISQDDQEEVQRVSTEIDKLSNLPTDELNAITKLTRRIIIEADHPAI